MQTYKNISIQDAVKLIEAGCTLVDIRDPASFAQGHIPDSTRLDNHSLPHFVQQADLDAPTLVVCYHGHASQSAAAYLHSLDFTEVYSLQGGFAEWSVQCADQIERQ